MSNTDSDSEDLFDITLTLFITKPDGSEIFRYEKTICNWSVEEWKTKDSVFFVKVLEGYRIQFRHGDALHNPKFFPDEFFSFSYINKESKKIFIKFDSDHVFENDSILEITSYKLVQYSEFSSYKSIYKPKFSRALNVSTY